ncbi:hypothetical protein AMK31_31150 [Streptomyces sp. TSRI0107]|nr:hypothetical protein AMK31_31150 [Streptomyces sp. TSRI0107]
MTAGSLHGLVLGDDAEPPHVRVLVYVLPLPGGQADSMARSTVKVSTPSVVRRVRRSKLTYQFRSPPLM